MLASKWLQLASERRAWRQLTATEAVGPKMLYITSQLHTTLVYTLQTPRA